MTLPRPLAAWSVPLQRRRRAPGRPVRVAVISGALAADTRARRSGAEQHQGSDGSDLYYHVFDMLPVEDFLAGRGAEPLSARQRRLRDALAPAIGRRDAPVQVVAQYRVRSASQLLRLFARVPQLGWEGLMLRRNVPYEGRRTGDLLKMRHTQECEARVVSIESARMRLYVDGREVERLALSRANVDYKGHLVGVGSGFTSEQRLLYHAHPELIVGCTVTLQHFGETHNQADGGLSLRFPTLKCVYGAERDV